MSTTVTRKSVNRFGKDALGSLYDIHDGFYAWKHVER